MPLPFLPFLPLIITPIVFAVAKRTADQAQKEADTVATPEPEAAALIPELASEPEPVVMLSSPAVAASSEADGHPASHATDADPITYWQPTETRGWIELTLPELQEVQQVSLSEVNGSHVQLYAVEYRLTEDGPWRTLFAGDTLGPEKIEDVPPTLALSVRLQILASDTPPAIATFTVA